MGSRVRGFQQLWLPASSARSVVAEHLLSCFAACGIFLDQGSNPSPPHWEVGSLPAESLVCVYMCVFSVVSDSAIPWTIACQAPLSMEFSRQEYWSGLPFPTPGDLPDPGIKPRSLALQADSLPLEPSGKYIYSKFFPIILYHRIFSIVPCAIQ